MGRFLQADPFIQARANSQNFNRYSYVLNNPLSYTDPSGYLFKKLLRPSGVALWGAGASQWVFGAEAGAISGQQAAMQIGTMTLAASNPALGQALMYLQGSWGQGFGGWAQNAVGQYGQYKGQQELARFAARNGLTLQELNLLLGLNSKLGFEIAGTTFDAEAGELGGFRSRNKWRNVGIFWDINDTLLNAQGLLDAVALSVVNMGYKGHIEGHSLGAWRANNLYRYGFVDSVALKSLPALSYPAAGTNGACINLDLICGGALMNWFRPGTVGQPSSSLWNLLENHDWNHYREARGN